MLKTYAVKSVFNYLKKEDGNWNSWSVWSPCTKTCGSGLRARNRDCNNPVPSNGGKACAGDPSDFQACNPTACPTVSPGTYVQVRSI